MDLHLNPYLVNLGPVGIRWYGFFMAVSMAIGIYYFVRRGRRSGVDEDSLYNFAFLVIVGGIIGARLVYLLTNWHYFVLYPGQILQIYNGGLAIDGAFIGGISAGLWYSYRKHLPFWALCDGLVPGAAMGIFLVRIGNIFNGEILGHPAGILGGMRQPAQVYEMVFGLILWVLFWRQERRQMADGVPFWTFMFWYGILRFISEFFRDNPQYIVHYTNHYLGIGVVTLMQWFTPLVIVLAVLGWRWRARVGAHSLVLAQDAHAAGQEPVISGEGAATPRA